MKAQRIRNLLADLRIRLQNNKLLVRAFHTFWQSFSVVFLAGLTDLLNVFAHHGLAAAQAALLALLVAAGAAGLSAVKTFITQYVSGKQV